MNGEVRFTCVEGCGACCRNLRVPLSVAEAIAWTGRGHAVDVLTEAMVVATSEATENDTARFKLPRSLPGACGVLPVAVNVVLAASFPDGPCPDLGDDARCRIYAERPAVCRVYPLEITPLVTFDPARKSCPSAAWDGSAPPFARGGAPLDVETRGRIEGARAAQIADVSTKARLCADLRIRTAGLSGEGFVVHGLDPETLREALVGACGSDREAPGDRWVVVTNRDSTLSALTGARGAGARARSGRIESDPDPRRAYLGLCPDGE